MLVWRLGGRKEVGCARKPHLHAGSTLLTPVSFVARCLQDDQGYKSWQPSNNSIVRLSGLGLSRPGSRESSLRGIPQEDPPLLPSPLSYPLPISSSPTNMYESIGKGPAVLPTREGARGGFCHHLSDSVCCRLCL